MPENRHFVRSKDEIRPQGAGNWRNTEWEKSMSGEGFNGYSYGDYSPPLPEMHI